MSGQMKEPTETSTPTSSRGLVGWALYDWANSPFTTLIITFVFAAYFSRGIVGDEVQGQALWGYVAGISAVFIAVLSPSSAQSPMRVADESLGFSRSVDFASCVRRCSGLPCLCPAQSSWRWHWSSWGISGLSLGSCSTTRCWPTSLVRGGWADGPAGLGGSGISVVWPRSSSCFSASSRPINLCSGSGRQTPRTSESSVRWSRRGSPSSSFP